MPNRGKKQEERAARRRYWLAAMPLIGIGSAAFGNPIVIENVDLIPMTDEVVLADRTLLIEKGRIAKICEHAADCLCKDASRIDGEGKFLIPGLTDMHAHIDGIGSVHEDDEASGAQRPDALRTQNQQLRQYLLFGVTTIRDPAGGPMNLRTRTDIASSKRMGPRLYTSWVPMDGNPKLHPITTAFSTPEEAADFVRLTKANGYDMVKIYSTLPLATFDAIMRAAREVGIPVGGHSPMTVPFDHVLQSGIRSIEHLSGYDMACSEGEDEYRPIMADVYQGWANCTPDEIEALAVKTARSGIWNDPTLGVLDDVNTDYQRFADIDETAQRYTPPLLGQSSPYLYQIFPARSRAGIQGTRETRFALVRALARAGAPLLIGTDTMASGYNVHREMGLFVEAGLTPYQALYAATAEPARYFEAEGRFGTIVEGASADVVLLDANPLTDIGNAMQIAGVMVRGKWLDRHWIAAEHAALATEYEEDRAVLELAAVAAIETAH